MARRCTGSVSCSMAARPARTGVIAYSPSPSKSATQEPPTLLPTITGEGFIPDFDPIGTSRIAIRLWCKATCSRTAKTRRSVPVLPQRHLTPSLMWLSTRQAAISWHAGIIRFWAALKPAFRPTTTPTGGPSTEFRKCCGRWISIFSITCPREIATILSGGWPIA